MENGSYSDGNQSYSYESEVKNSYSSFSYETIGTSTCNQTEEQLINLQTEILQQVRQIDNYVNTKNQSPKKKSQSFFALQHLYSLFKQELQLNFSIRRALIQEKQFNEQATIQCAAAKNQINHFLAKVSKQTGIDFTSLKQVTDHLSDLFTVRKQKGRIVTKQSDNVKLLMQIEKLKASIEEIEAQKAVEIAEMQARIDIETSKSEELKAKLNDLQYNRSETMQSVYMNKQKEFEQLQEQFQQIQARNMKEISDTRVLLSEKINTANKLEQDVSNLKRDLQMVTRERDELRGNAANFESIQQVRESLRKVEKELQLKKAENKKLRKERNALIKCINEQKVIHDASIRRIDELQEKLLKIESKYKKIAHRKRSQSVNFNYQSKRNYIRGKFDSIDPSVQSENRNMQNQLVRALSDVRKLEDENSSLMQRINSLQRELSFGRNDYQSNYERYGIIDAFNTLRNGLGLGLQATPEMVVQFILKTLNRNVNDNHEIPQNDRYNSNNSSIGQSFSEVSYGSQSTATNELQAQIDSLQNEVLSLKGEVTKYTQ